MAGNAAETVERGRQAETPGEINFTGWKDIARRVASRITEDRVMLVAGGVTYYLLLSLVPSLTALISVYGLFADPATMNDHMAALRGIVPGGGMEILEAQVDRLAAEGSEALGAAFVIGLGLALWSANAGMKSLFEAMNVAYGEREKRGFVSLNLVSLTCTAGAIIAAIVFISMTIAVPIGLNFVGISTEAEWVVRGASYLILFVVALGGVAVLYRFGVSRVDARWLWVTPGALVALVVIIVASILFSWYVSNFGSYNTTYGSLGAMIGFMTWIWISLMILIIGAEFNAEMEHQTVRDTTVGRNKPMGTRGAVMADTVGPAMGEKDDYSFQGENDKTSVPGSAAQAGPQGLPAGNGRVHTERPEAGRSLRMATMLLAIPAVIVYRWARRR